MDVNILLFENFESLDVFGPVEIFGRIDDFNLKYISFKGGNIRSSQSTLILTDPIDKENLSGVLLIPGGMGTRMLVEDADFIETLRSISKTSTYCLTVCTGSALLAKTGLLDGRRATSNKLAFDWVQSVNTKVDWIDKARWIIDGKYYTSSGVSAGMDMTLGFIKDRFGKELAEKTATSIEYIWNSDMENDPFSR